MERILILAKENLEKQYNEKKNKEKDNINFHENLKNSIKKFEETHSFKEYIKQKNQVEEIENNEKYDFHAGSKKIKLELSKIELMLKKKCDHDFHVVYGEDDMECIKCGWYKSEIYSI